MEFIIVAVGAGFGGGLRYWMSEYISKVYPAIFPYGTLAVNLLGSILLGVLIFGFHEKGNLHPSLKLFIGVGFCGGLTTFSTFSLETFHLLKNTEFLFASLNVLLNTSLTLAGIYIGYIVTR